MSKLITSSAMFDALHQAGMFDDDPTMVRRVVIDLQAGSIAKVYVERFTDDEKLRAGLQAFLNVETDAT